MYRATVKEISGRQVLADGKWLTIIGNKPVKVGDRVYTDGRCVYGFYQESQQPLVITSKVEWGIPIAIDYKAYIYTASGLKEIGAFNMITRSYYRANAMTNGDDNVVVARSANTVLDVWALNTKNGNIYTLGLYVSNIYDDNGYISGTEEFLRVRKNDETISTIKLSGTVKAAFIEDENNWYVIYDSLYKDTINDYYTRTWWEEFWFERYQVAEYVWMEPPAYIRAIFYHNERKSFRAWNLQNNEGTSTLIQLDEYNFGEWTDYFCQGFPIFDSEGGRHQPSDELSTYYLGPVENPISESSVTNNYEGKRVPMHNGYYYEVNFAKLESSGYIEYCNVSVFDPNDNLILTETFTTFPYIVACKVNSGYLVGLKNLKSLQDGLYLVRNTELELLKAGDIRNQKLQKMKKNYKNWIDNVQLVYSGWENENELSD